MAIDFVKGCVSTLKVLRDVKHQELGPGITGEINLAILTLENCLDFMKEKRRGRIKRNVRASESRDQAQIARRLAEFLQTLLKG